ncbi:methionyl-tRNA formyltransferase [Protaetiibacter intestinalis]|uniref:Methionyl-tRNA formyltransferase n=1 Tax=Protaetiibacter intestinalis TaxID=2419774 RepID=A0A387BDH6_9MICO|nr:methionyl-tRNA formyltransferase [Protaetiibacter intestinalis]AYF99096.1 methionyl-tRNA formyltransferase [Protaetiibacter intestinalis]
MRLIFAGSPAAAVPSLRALLDSRHEVVAVVTREDAPQGRKRVLTPTPVAELAEEAGIRVIKANRLATVTAELLALEADLGVVVAYGGLIREPVLSAPRHGWINLHFSLLPRWRGAAPVQRAVMAGDAETGAAVFQLVEELDAGPVFAMERATVGRVQTAGHLLEALSVSGARLLVGVVDAIEDGTATAIPQEGEVTLAPKLTLDDGRIDWTLPVARVDALIRGVTPEPGATTLLDGERFKIHEAAIAHGAAQLPPGALAQRGKAVHVGTGDEPLELRTVQPAGKRAMPAADWWRGRPAGATSVFG